MKQVASSDMRPVTIILRFTAATLAVISALVLFVPFSLTVSKGALSLYQFVGIALSALVFTLTFEGHFADYWEIEAAAFFGASLVIWSGIAIAINSALPAAILIIGVPVATLLLPWNWQFELGVCALCIGAAVVVPKLAHRGVADCNPLWLVASAEGVIAVLANLELELQSRQTQAYVGALLADEEQFRALIENAPDGLWVFNASGSIVFQSPSARQMMGEELAGRSIYEFLHQDNVGTFRAMLEQCMKTPRENCRIRVRCRRAGESWWIIEGVGKQLENYGEEPLVVFNWRDVTDRVNQENQLRESEERFRKIFQYSTNAISIISHDGNYLDVNDEWLRLFGHERSEVIGKNPLELGRYADPDDYMRIATDLLMKREVRDRAVRFRAKDGSLIEALVSSVLLQTAGNFVVLSVITPTSRRR
jgi:PAS domain S-box-containing protein